eukprot:scaffold41006_cov39-Tisochrysis_lutea.AAC.3
MFLSVGDTDTQRGATAHYSDSVRTGEDEFQRPGSANGSGCGASSSSAVRPGYMPAMASCVRRWWASR